MTDREKIISIIGNVPNVGILSFDVISKIANYLISHGVTVREKGEWIVKKTAIGRKYTICDRCNTVFSFITDKGTFEKIDLREAYFCPNCGADMRKRGDIK